MIFSLKRTDVRCPAMCFVLEEKKDPQPGMLYESEESGKLFCTTNGCAFAFIDEHKAEHWVGGQIKMWQTETQESQS